MSGGSKSRCPRLKAYAVGLAQGHFVGLERVCEIIGDQCGVQPSDWSVQQWIVKAAGKTALEPTQLADLLARHDRQIKIGLDACPVRLPEPGGRTGPVAQHDATNLLLRLRDYKEQVLRFLTDWRVPFDNNLAERMVR